MITIYTWSDGTELYHHGILGQKWGVRRYQNPDGSLTAAGEKRYNGKNGELKKAKDDYRIAKKQYNKSYNKSYAYSRRHPISQFTNEKKKSKSDKLWDKTYEDIDNMLSKKESLRKIKIEKEKPFKDAKTSYKASRSTGHKIASVMLLGAFGNMTYNDLRTAGYSKGESIGLSYASALIAGPIGNIVVSEIVKNKYKNEN